MISLFPSITPADSQALGQQRSLVVWGQMIGGMADGTKYANWGDATAHVPEAVHGRSFVEAVHAPTGARVAIDALHALRGWAALSASRDGAGAFARCERSPFWAQEEAAAVARARRGGGGAGEADDARARPAPAWDWTFETDYGGTLGRAGDGAPDGSRVAEAVEHALRERLLSLIHI